MTTTTEARPLTTAAELLEAAADHMATVGWLQGDLYPADVADPYTAPCCMLGAVRAAARVPLHVIREDHHVQSALVREAEEFLATQVYQSSGVGIWDGDDFDAVETVGEWNDADNCCIDSAISMLRDAAELAR